MYLLPLHSFIQRGDGRQHLWCDDFGRRVLLNYIQSKELNHILDFNSNMPVYVFMYLWIEYKKKDEQC